MKCLKILSSCTFHSDFAAKVASFCLNQICLPVLTDLRSDLSTNIFSFVSASSIFSFFFCFLYPKVSNRPVVRNSSGDWKKYQKLIVEGVGKSKKFNSWGEFGF